MKRTIFLALFMGIFLPQEIDYQVLHEEAIVVDLHSDTLMRVLQGFQLGERHTEGHMDIPRLKEGGIDLQVFACFVSSDYPADKCAEYVHQMIDSMEVQLKKNANNIALCRTAKEAEQIIASGKIAAFLGIENGVAIENSLEELQKFFDRGVRYMTITHAKSNDWAISSADTMPQFNGLTDFGRQVVRKMNELGMIIDISHAAESTFWEVLKVTKDPIIASHSCVWALNPVDRNLKDEQIKAIARNGGVIGINFYSGYISKEYNEKASELHKELAPRIQRIRARYGGNPQKMQQEYSKIRKEFQQATKDVKVTIEQLVDHIDYIVKLVGPDYVALGSDFDGISAAPEGLEDCSKVPLITNELVRRGYSEKDIRKILGGNFLRVFRKVSR